MKLLLDSCVWGGATKTLRSLGHNVEWVGDWPKDPGDAQIIDDYEDDLRAGALITARPGRLRIRLPEKQ